MLRTFVLPWLTAVACLILLLVPQIASQDVLFPGATSYAFYAHSVSSNARIVTATGAKARQIKLCLLDRRGESAYYPDAAQAFEQAKRYGMKPAFCEQAGDVINYYGFSEELGDGVLLDGHRVNLHIAVRAEGACIGTPLIFGGY